MNSRPFFVRTTVLLLAGFGFAMLWLAPQAVLAATTVTGTPSTNLTSVPRYTKFELTFSISRSYPDGSPLPYYYYDSADTPANNTIPNRTSPYGADGITINTVFTSPTGKTLTVPSFYYQDYIRTRNGSYEVLNKANNPPVWKTRFAPAEIGTYNYYITIQDKDGTTRYPAAGNLSFTSVTSDKKGFVRPSTRDPRFFDFDNGTSFIPIAGQAQWWDCCSLKSYFYDDRFAQFKQGGVNLVRIWDQNDGYALSLEGTWDNKPTDAQAIAGPKGTYIDQADAYREDKILESAETNDVYIELSSHGDVYWNWDASVYGLDGQSDKWNTNPVNFTNKYHLNYWYRNFRYRVARFGYSTSVLSWETWNENGHIVAGTDIYNFYQTLNAYEKANDPYGHARTTSLSSQNYSPGFWSSAAADIANYHDYMMISRYDSSLAYDEANFVYRFSQCLRYTNGSGCSLGLGDGSTWVGTQKPWIWGEIGIEGRGWDDSSDPDFQQGNSGEASSRSKQNIMWAGLFSPLGTSPVPWMSLDSTQLTKYLQYTKVARDYFSTVDYSALKFDHLPTSDTSIAPYTGDKLTSSNSTVRAFVLRSQDKKTILAWAQNKNFTWKNANTTPAGVSANITVPNVPAGTYKVEYWNTDTGAITQASDITSNGSLTFPVNNLQRSVAVKLISGGGSTTNPACLADLNGDKLVDLSDYALLVSNFFKSGVGDINKDGLVDLTDYGLLTKSFLLTCN
jgi:hypothetical protein